MTDIEIAQNAQMKNITEIAEKVGAGESDIEMYGRYMAKFTDDFLKDAEAKEDGKLVLVTAINPTPAGEGKTTVTIGLGEALNRIGKKTVIALREPSLGPCFGVKGGAAGGGYAQVVPMEKLNLHFTGDFHAITSANNLLCACLDNILLQGNDLSIDPNRIVIKRCVDMNDRALRNIVIGMGKRMDGVVREDHFVITVATEIMAVLCLANDLNDLRDRLSRMIVAYTYDNKPVTANEIGCVGAMTALLVDAIRPNLIQTLENNPAIVHGGPFANIAHGCNSVRATKLALKLGDIAVTEAGFGADLGAEKFLDIKCRAAGLKPDCAVLVATVRALKYNGGVKTSDLSSENIEALKTGIENLGKHIENLKKYGIPIVVTLNRFSSDTDEELEFVKKYCENLSVRCTVSEVWGKGSEGGTDLAEAVLDVLQNEAADFKPIYDSNESLTDKINIIAKEIYGADGADISKDAKAKIDKITEMGFGGLPVCVAKTQYSLSDDPSLLGRPEGFKIEIKDAYVSAGAGFVVMLAGSIMTMPGLPKDPAAYHVDVDEDGQITGLF